jgi:hypothetical protein
VGWGNWTALKVRRKQFITAVPHCGRPDKTLQLGIDRTHFPYQPAAVPRISRRRLGGRVALTRSIWLEKTSFQPGPRRGQTKIIMHAQPQAPRPRFSLHPRGQTDYRVDLAIRLCYAPPPQIEVTSEPSSFDSCTSGRAGTNSHISTGFQGARCLIDRHRSLHQLRILRYP